MILKQRSRGLSLTAPGDFKLLNESDIKANLCLRYDLKTHNWLDCVLGTFVKVLPPCEVFSYRSKLLWRKTRVLHSALIFNGVLNSVQY